MRKNMIVLIALIIVEVIFANSISAESFFVYFGTQTKGQGENVSKGIYRSHFDLETGELSEPLLAAEAMNPGFLELHPNGRFLYATSFMGISGSVNAYATDSATGELTLLNSQPSGGIGPCHVNVDPAGKNVLVANYGGGSVSVIPIKAKGSLGIPTAVVQHKGSSVNLKRQKEPHPHSVNLSPDGRFAYVADLGTDKIVIYQLDTENGVITPANPPHAKVKPGAGPRHFTFHPNGKYAYVINELDCTVTAFSFSPDSGALTEIQTVPTIPNDYEGNNSTAEVRVHPGGKFLYGSNRGHNSIAVYRINPQKGTLKFVEREIDDIQVPRNFNIDPTGRFCLVANQGSDSVVVFRIDPKTGALEPTGNKITVPKPICVRFLRSSGMR